MRFMENRLIAFVVLAACIVFSLSFSSGRALSNLRAETEQVFYQGVDGSGLSIDRDLSVQAECAYNLASTAANYAISDSLISAAREASDRLKNAETMSGKYQAASQCTRAVEDLYTAISNIVLTQADQSFALKNYKEFGSRGDTVRRNSQDYNDPAQAFNRERNGFPASILAGLSGISPLELYQ